MKLIKTLDFYHSFFTKIQIVDTQKCLQTRIDIGFVGDGLYINRTVVMRSANAD
jgi:hypothetical protein